MAKNDVILLDSVVEKAKDNYVEQGDMSSYFELFCFDQLLKDYDLSLEELQSGWVDGGDDGGIDGFFLFLDGILLSDVPDDKSVRRFPELQIVIITCKHADTFKQVPINNLIATLPELFDLSKDADDIVSSIDESILNVRELFCQTYKELAARQPHLGISIIYASRGDTSLVAENILNRANLLKQLMTDLFSNCQTSVRFVGATELLAMYRTQRSFSLRLKFIESYISRAQTNYIVLSRLSDFYRFVTDEDGRLRRYLFEANVRDYLGSVAVNQDIAETLQGHQSSSELDFWWLNNGITIIASSAHIAGKELNLENIQIVNGLQTTETIHKYFTERGFLEDGRAVLIKILVTRDDEVRDKIIKATNFQTSVDLASLRATDKIQRDIEHILQDHGWYYDRRKNFFRNQGKPAKQIVSTSYLASALQALPLRNPRAAVRLRPRFMRVDEEYQRVFDKTWDIRVFLVSLQIVKRIETILAENPKAFVPVQNRFPTNFRFLFAYIWASQQLGTVFYPPNSLLTLETMTIKKEDLLPIWDFILATRDEFAATLTQSKASI